MRAERRGRGALSEINVTPLVDVMLVLLIIFMVTAPLLKQGMDVELPEAKSTDLPPEERVNITIKKDGAIYLNESPVSIEAMRAKLDAIAKLNPNVYLRADRNVPYGSVVRVMGEIKDAGIEKLGIIAEPQTRIR